MLVGDRCCEEGVDVRSLSQGILEECLEGGEVASYACLLHGLFGEVASYACFLHGLFSVVNSSFVRLVLYSVGGKSCCEVAIMLQ